jgi:putative redox protein
MVKVDWIKDRVFEASPPSGVKFTIDSHPEFGGTMQGPTPVETLLGAIAACSAIDVLAILEKKRQKVTSYRVEVDGDRVEPGTYPRPFTALRVRHILTGENLDPAAVARAVELSDEKYCSVIATLRGAPAVSSVWAIEPLAAVTPQ